MDREIDGRSCRKRILRRLIRVVLFGVPLMVSVSWAVSHFRPSLDKGRIQTAVVDAGPLESVIDASGVVEPELEGVIASPIATRVVRVLKRTGEKVSRGEPIIELDTSLAHLQLERAEQLLRVKENEERIVNLELAERTSLLDSLQQIASLELESKQSEQERITELSALRLVSKAQLDRTKAERRKAALELKRIETEAQQAFLKAEALLTALEMEMDILEKEVAEAQRQLMLATTRSDRDGIVTWVLSEEGRSVQAGDTVARIADLNSFRVRATVSDLHSARVSSGLPVEVLVNGQRLGGAIQRVLPTISEGIMTLLVALDEPGSPLLRSNLRVDVRIIVDRKDKVLRLKRGPAIRGSGLQEVFVVKDERAVRTPVHLGMASFDRFEVVSGLSEGEMVVVSDVVDYLHMPEIPLK